MERDPAQPNAPAEVYAGESGPAPSREELALLQRLRDGDERAFTEIIERHHGPLRRLARMFVSTDASAEEVAQETWLAVLDGLRRFEGRSSLKTWIFRILVNRARTRGVREARTVPFSSLGAEEDGGAEPAVDPARFDERGMWSAPPERWDQTSPEALLAHKDTAQVIEAAVAALPDRQRAVVTLRDIEGWTTEEVCNVLEITETNQRVLLHRARAKLRAALEHTLTRR